MNYLITFVMALCGVVVAQYLIDSFPQFVDWIKSLKAKKEDEHEVFDLGFGLGSSVTHKMGLFRRGVVADFDTLRMTCAVVIVCQFPDGSIARQVLCLSLWEVESVAGEDEMEQARKMVDGK